MKNYMRVEEGFNRNLNPKDYPYGHILIRSRNPLNETPSYWGEIDLRKTKRLTLYYTIEDFNLSEKRYGVAIFIDREFQIRLFEASVTFLDNDTRLVEPEISFMQQSISFVPLEFFKFIHLLIYWRLTQFFPAIYFTHPEPHILAAMESGFVCSVQQNTIEDFVSETSIDLCDLISTMDIILH